MLAAQIFINYIWPDLSKNAKWLKTVMADHAECEMPELEVLVSRGARCEAASDSGGADLLGI